VALGTGLLVAALVALPARAAAALPAAYGAWVIEPTGLPDRAEFDLTAPLARARRDGKRLYVYLGASDCAFCRAYETFLERNAGELVPHFGGWLIVDLRSALRVQAQTLHLRAGGRSLPYAEFQRSIGDERARQLVYPSVWLFDADLKPLMQMPAGTGTFQTVPEQLEILRLEQ
jgi:thiol-disulfide isomerase/thioredoxin